MPPKILGLPLDPYVNDQINKRQTRLSSFDKTVQDNLVFNARSSWVKLASSVDLKSQVSIDGNQINTDRVTKSANIIGISEPEIAGSNLAKKAVLFGGVLQYDAAGNEKDVLGGFGYGLNNAYGFLSKNNDVNYGFKPMPGVTDVRVSYKNNGTLKQAQIKITAHTLPQFQAIELLYLRIGYTMLLEWGHTDYFDNDDSDNGSSYTGIISTLTDDFLIGTYNNNHPKLLADIEKTKQKRSGNYDALYGKVSNFSWTLNNDLGYDITVDLISLGDIIDSLKFNSQSKYASVLPSNITIDKDKFPLTGLVNIALNKGDSGFNAFLYELRQAILTEDILKQIGASSEEIKDIVDAVKEENQKEKNIDIWSANRVSFVSFFNKAITYGEVTSAVSGLSDEEKQRWNNTINKIKATNSADAFKALGVRLLSKDDDTDPLIGIHTTDNSIFSVKQAIENAYDSPNSLNSDAEKVLQIALENWALGEGYSFPPFKPELKFDI
jgi:hypothetical protein